jgi:hypothetical protein
MTTHLFRKYRIWTEHKSAGETPVLVFTLVLSISYEKRIYLDIQKRCPSFKIAMNAAAPDGTPPWRFE